MLLIHRGGIAAKKVSFSSIFKVLGSSHTSHKFVTTIISVSTDYYQCSSRFHNSLVNVPEIGNATTAVVALRLTKTSIGAQAYVVSIAPQLGSLKQSLGLYARLGRN